MLVSLTRIVGRRLGPDASNDILDRGDKLVGARFLEHAAAAAVHEGNLPDPRHHL